AGRSGMVSDHPFQSRSNLPARCACHRLPTTRRCRPCSGVPGLSMFDPAQASALDIARAGAEGATTASAAAERSLPRSAMLNPVLNAVTDVTTARADARGAAIDARRAQGEPVGPLAGVPFAVKNLFDIAGLPTRAGSKINRARPPAERDSPLIERLEAAG